MNRFKIKSSMAYKSDFDDETNFGLIKELSLVLIDIIDRALLSLIINSLSEILFSMKSTN